MQILGSKMRRAHLITPFGVGALSTMVNGVTVITASLDAWFYDFNGNYIEPQDMEIQDWRLHKQLHISNLRLPPRGADTVFRGNLRRGQVSTSFVPVLRFPRWNKCQFCNTLTQFPLSFSGEASCQNLDCKSKSVFQVSIVVACENGHLDDFPCPPMPAVTSSSLKANSRSPKSSADDTPNRSASPAYPLRR